MTNNYPPAKPLSHWKRYSPTEARTSDEQQTVRQTAGIRGISNSQNIDADAACQHLFNCVPDHLNKAAARTYIDWLTKQPKQLHPSHALNFCPVDGCNQLQAVTYEAATCGNGHFFLIAEVAS